MESPDNQNLHSVKRMTGLESCKYVFSNEIPFRLVYHD